MRFVVRFIATFVGFAAVCEGQSGRPGSVSLRTPSRSAVFGVVGCYAFFDSAGRAASEKLYWAPATARLDSNGHAVKLTPKLDAGALHGGPGSYRWSINATGDSLRVLFHNGFSICIGDTIADHKTMEYITQHIAERKANVLQNHRGCDP